MTGATRLTARGRTFVAAAVVLGAMSSGCGQSPAPARTRSEDGAGALSASQVRAESSPAAHVDAATHADAGTGSREDTPSVSAPSASFVVDAPRPTFDEVRDVLFPDRASAARGEHACPPSVPTDARIRCLYDARYQGDAKASALAHELYVRFGIVAGVEAAHSMDGGYRGIIRIEPAVPVAAERRHLEWVVGAVRDFDTFFSELDRFAKEHGGVRPAVGVGTAATSPRPYRFRPITLRFMRSVGVRTPAAYAHDWTVAYNLVGSINVSGDAVRETMFHEVFHLNDATHAPPGGSGNWSASALAEVFDAIVRKCGTRTACLAAYAPGDTMVKGGTYYAFQPGNGVGEYAAELALRYYREQRAALRGLPSAPGTKPFKCGPPENGRAWTKMKDEFFGGTDATAACASP